MRRLALVIVLSLLSPALFAQYKNIYTGNSFNNAGSALMDSFIRSNMNQQLLMDQIKKSNQKTTAQKAPEKPVTPPAPFDYSKTCFKGTGTHSVPEQIVKGAEGLAEKDRKELVTKFGEAIDEFEKQVNAKNNLSYGITFLLGVSLKIVKGIDVGDEDSEAMAQEVHREILANPNWEKMTDDQKQQIYEACVVNATIMIGLSQSNEEDSVRMANEQATQALGIFGIKN